MATQITRDSWTAAGLVRHPPGLRARDDRASPCDISNHSTSRAYFTDYKQMMTKDLVEDWY